MIAHPAKMPGNNKGEIVGSYVKPTCQTDFIEPVATLPIYCDGLAMVEAANGNMHLSLYVEQPVPGQQPDRVINLRVIIPLDGIATALPVIIKKLATSASFRMTERGWKSIAGDVGH